MKKRTPDEPRLAGWGANDADWLTEPPPPREWLLRHDGAGVLPRGIVGMLAAPGGRGKTRALAQLVMAIASGRPWLDAFEVTAPGRVVFLVAEEDERELRERLYLAANELGLSTEERFGACGRIVAAACPGPVGLIRPGTRGTLVTSDVYQELLENLEGEAGPYFDDDEPDAPPDPGLALVVLDPLARWAPGAETNTDAAMATMTALEAITRLHGAPTVLVAHHTSQSDRERGGADTSGARGVTALTDSARWVCKLTGRTETDLAIAVTKSNYTPTGLRVPLERDPRSGILRRASEEGRAALDLQREIEEGERVEKMAAELLRRLAKSKAPVTSQAELKGLVKGKASLKAAAVRFLRESGRLKGGNGRPFLFAQEAAE